MARIKNQNDMVKPYVDDYKKLFKEDLISVILYGSAATHEFIPGKSDINIAMVLKDNSIKAIEKSLVVQRGWNKKGVSIPFFMTPEYIDRSSDTYPLEFLDMKTAYRIIYGEDMLEGLELNREYIRLQCERELRSVAIHLRRAYMNYAGKESALRELLMQSLKRLVPVFKGMVHLDGKSIKSIPTVKSDLFSLIESIYALGASSFSDIYANKNVNLKSRYLSLFNQYANDVDILIEMVDHLNDKTEG